MRSFSHYDVLPLQKRGLEKVVAMLKGCTKSVGIVLTWKLDVLAIMNGGTKEFSPLKWVRGHRQIYCLEEVVQKVPCTP